VYYFLFTKCSLNDGCQIFYKIASLLYFCFILLPVLICGIPSLLYFAYLLGGLLIYEVNRGCVKLGLWKESEKMLGNSAAERYALLSRPVKDLMSEKKYIFPWQLDSEALRWK